MILSLVVALSRNRVIGAAGRLPWHLPDDLAHFRRVTMGKPLIVGRSTYESIGRPLPGRRMIVLSRSPRDITGCECVNSVAQALELVKGCQEVMIGGGSQVYQLFLPIAHRQYLTEVDMEVEGDAFYPSYPVEDWEVRARVEGVGCTYVTLERRVL